LKKIKLVVSDIDGTLTSDDAVLGDMTKDYILKLKSTDVRFTVATQKIYSSTLEIIKDLNLHIPFITSNGRYIRNTKGEILIENYLKPKFVLKVLKLARNYSAQIALCTNFEILYTESNASVKNLHHRFGTQFKLVDNYESNLENIVEIIVFSYFRKVVKAIKEKVDFPFGLFVESKYFKLSSTSGVYNLDINCAGFDKNTALKALSKHLKIPKDEIAVIGDWYNDLDLFKFGGLNITLSNAVPRLRFLADYIIPETNNEDGVGHFLKMIYDVKTNNH
jgi:Cof subfamily protein (haloacid dehalogenase superfamily)